jgi:hypothetical protein
MIMKKLVLLSMLMGINSFAVGIAQVEAKVESFNEKDVILVLKDKRKVRVPKTVFSKGQQDGLKIDSMLTFSMSEKDLNQSVIKKK